MSWCGAIMVSSELLGEGADDIAIGDHDRLNLKDLLDICKPPPPPFLPPHYPTTPLRPPFPLLPPPRVLTLLTAPPLFSPPHYLLYDPTSLFLTSPPSLLPHHTFYHPTTSLIHQLFHYSPLPSPPPLLPFSTTPPPTLPPHHPLHYPTYLVFLGSTTKAK